jgi:hypothetical protein
VLYLFKVQDSPGMKWITVHAPPGTPFYEVAVATRLPVFGSVDENILTGGGHEWYWHPCMLRFWYVIACYCTACYSIACVGHSQVRQRAARVEPGRHALRHCLDVNGTGSDLVLPWGNRRWSGPLVLPGGIQS